MEFVYLFVGILVLGALFYLISQLSSLKRPSDESAQKLLLDVMEKLIANHKLREMMGIRARKLVENKYSWSKIAKSLERLYMDNL